MDAAKLHKAGSLLTQGWKKKRNREKRSREKMEKEKEKKGKKEPNHTRNGAAEKGQANHTTYYCA